MSRPSHRLSALTGFLLAAALAPVAGFAPADAAQPERWRQRIAGGRFQWSSPVIADVNGDGRNDVVVGGLNGRLYAWDADGNPLPGAWRDGAVATASVASSPAVGDVDGDGRAEVVVGTGSLELGDAGAINIFNADGGRRCALATNPGHEGTAVYNAPAIGDVTGDGVNDIVFGAFDHLIRVVNGQCGVLASFDNTDSIFSAPALHDIDGNGTAEIFIGGDATKGPAGQSHNGGYFRSLTYRAGHSAFGESNLVQRWERTSTETFQSSAAIGDVDGDGDLEVVTGSGAYYCRWKNVCGDSNKVWAFDLDDGGDAGGWPKRSTFETTFLGSPALGDIDGDGRTDVVVITNQYNQGSPHKEPNGGAVDAFFANGGRDTYVVQGDIEVMTAPVLADLDGGGPEIIISDNAQMLALNRNMDVVRSEFATHLAHKNAAAIGDLRGAAAPGTPRWALVTAGFEYQGPHAGVVSVYDIATPASVPWPQFQMDARRFGNDLYAPNAPKSPTSGIVPVTNPPAPTTTVTTRPRPNPTTTTRRTAPPTTAAPPTTVAETTTTLPPETTTTLPPETTTTTIEDTTELVELAAKDEPGGDGGGTALVGVLLGLAAVGGGSGLFYGWRRRKLG